MSSNREKSMAKRSDFAQKLLDDLRLRKERLASSQNPTNMSCMPADKYGYPSRGFQRSGETKAKNTSLEGLAMQNNYIGGSTSLTRVEASNQILPFRRGQSSEKIDLSKALAFALENAGKATRLDPSGSASIISFLHQVGRRSMERRGGQGMHQPSSSKLPMIHVHIKEISKGAQKLNQIIKACSNGLGFGNGKELMQGAIELEQSLRMLVNVQEGSGYATGSQKKSRIKLLDDNGEDDDDDDDDENAKNQNEQMQLGMPSGNYQNINMRLSALAYPEDDNIDRRKYLKASSHRRSVTCDETGLSAFTVDNNQSRSSKSGTGRIPNVIAKLMGLGEFPEDEDPKCQNQNESTSKTEIEKDVSVKSGKVDQRRKDADVSMKNSRQRLMQANRVAALENLVAPKAQRNSISSDTVLDSVMHDETHAENVARNKTKSQKHIWEKERGKDDEKSIRQNNAVKDEVYQVASKKEAQRTAMININRRATATDANQEEKVYNPNAPQIENKQKSSKLVLRRQQKPHHLTFESKQMLHKSEPGEVVSREEKRYNEKEHLQGRRQKANVSVTHDSPKPFSSVDVKKKIALTNKAKTHRKSFSETVGSLHTNRSPNGNHKSKPSDGSLHFPQADEEGVNHKISRIVPSPPDLETQLNGSDNPLGKKEKPDLIQVAQKAKEGNVHKSENPRNINQVMAKQNQTLGKLTRPLENQNSGSKEGLDGRPEVLSSCKDTDQIRSNQTEVAEAKTSMSGVSVADIQASDRIVADRQRMIKDDSLLLMLITRQNGSQMFEGSPGHAPADNFQETMLRGGTHLQAPTISDDNANTSSKAMANSLKGTKGEMKTQKLPTRKITETLSESEVQLKKIFLKSQLFLDAAEAHFKLRIPLSVLHSGGNNYNRDDNNLILDCGYELMKRKGRLQELSIHPFVKVPIGSSKVKSLDDLIKQLSKELERLKSYGREACKEPVVEDYLPKILERDVHYKDPELNSMWDMGWSDSMFVFIERDDVIRDIERFVFNGLVEEVTRDLICI